jgi:hypothetical protein
MPHVQIAEARDRQIWAIYSSCIAALTFSVSSGVTSTIP